MVMTTDAPLCTLGPEGMDFRPGGYVMSHAVNSPKPWARDYMKFALQGKPPSLSDKGFWENSEHPIRLFPESIVRKRNLALKAAIAVGRVWHRPWARAGRSSPIAPLSSPALGDLRVSRIRLFDTLPLLQG